jgi:ornithine carbamoyltransferase
MATSTEIIAPTDLLRVTDFARPQLDQALGLASQMKARPLKWVKALRGQSLACFFEQPSTRTRISFAAAAYRLGMLPIMLRPEELQLGRGETVADTARIISSYASAIVVRTLAQGTLEEMAGAAHVPIINGLSDMHHPCQALADLLTLRERFGWLQGLRLAYVGDGNNVCHSLIEAGALAGLRVSVATPECYRPNPDIVAGARAIAAETGASITLLTDPHEAVANADAVYTDVWVSMGKDAEAARLRAELAPYQVDAALMARAKPNAVFMHCLPAHRGEEVTAEVIDGPGSIVWAQAANRMPIEQAIVYLLISGRWRDFVEEW